MNKRIFPVVFTLFFILLVFCAKSQKLEVFEIFPENYPTIMVEFKVFDNEGKEVRTFTSSDFQVLENTITRAIQGVGCPPIGQTKFSLILTIDISYSMAEPSTIPGKTKMDVVRQAARNAIKSLPADSNRWEAAITLFDYENVLVRNFTNSKWWLNKGLDTFLLAPRAGTDYNAGLLYDVYGNEGAVLVARRAKYKPVVIFLTDGEHNGRQNPPPSRTSVWVSQILDSARKYNVTIYAITLGFPVPPELSAICGGTPHGEAFKSVPSEEELNNLYSSILTTIGTLGPPAPCRLRFISDCSGGLGNIVYKPSNLADSFSYKVPSRFLPAIHSNDKTIYVLNRPYNQPFEKTINIVAKNNFVNVNSPGVTSQFNNVEVTDWGGTPPPFKLEKDSSRTIKIKFTPHNDSLYHTDKFNLTTSACDGNEFVINSGWVYPLDVDCGSGVVGQTKTLQQKILFCNNWYEPLTIYSVRISGGDQGDFRLLGGTTNLYLAPFSCLEMNVAFTPSDPSFRQSTLYFDTQKGRFESKIFGSGSGFPEISTYNSISFPNLDCKKRFYDTAIVIKNTGALELEITNFQITGPNATDFSFIPSNPGTVKIAPESQYVLNLRVNASTKGNISANLVITSNAKNHPTLSIPLTCFVADRTFSSNLSNLDFGVICPNEVKKMNLTIQNTGNVQITLNLSLPSPFTVPSSSITLAPNASETLEIALQSPTEGTFTSNLSISDDYCNEQKRVSLTGNVHSPKIDKAPITIFGIVGNTKDTSIILRNTSNRALTITSANFSDKQLTILGPALPWNLSAGGTLKIDIRYLPEKSGGLNAFLKLTGEPCNFLDSILFTSNPIASRAELFIDEHKGLVGEIINIPILVRNPVNLEQSGTTRVRTRINYDQNILKFVGTNPNVIVTLGTNSLLLDNIPFSPTTRTLIVISFEVLNSATLSTTLDINSSGSIDGFVYFTEVDGKFTILPSSAEIVVAEVSANTGEEFILPLYLKMPNNVTDFHQSISTEIRFNYTLMEPIGDTPKGIVKDGETKILLTGLPIKPIASDSAIAKLKFRAKLGNNTTTDIIIENTKTAKGLVNFKETKGKFTLLNVCSSGGLRLFEPGLNPFYSVIINANEQKVYLKFYPYELGNHKFRIYNVYGIQFAEFSIDIKEAREYKIDLPFEQIPEGIYFVTAESQTSFTSVKFIWLK
ncbi:MAG: choice-of-anchor D domain-containing protein [Ignavibacteria bacterium]|nr:choice-of-anchor D domain-containing protein [Ignavibacteria bacterium]